MTVTAAGRRRGRLAWTLALTGGFLIVEVIGGLSTGSLALLADAGHMVTDVGGLALALVAIRIGVRPATPERTYGWYRVEILAAMANAVVLFGISIYILYEAYRRFQSPPDVASLPMLCIGVVGLLVNVSGMLLLRSGATESLNLRGAYLELLSDMVSSIGVIVAAGVMWLTGWRAADPLISAGIGVFILPRTWRLLNDAIGILLEGTPSDVDPAALREAVAAVPGVMGVHDLHVWALTSGTNALSVHVVRAASVSADQLLASVHARIRSISKIAHMTVQVEPEGWAHGETHL